MSPQTDKNTFRNVPLQVNFFEDDILYFRLGVLSFYGKGDLPGGGGGGRILNVFYYPE